MRRCLPVLLAAGVFLSGPDPAAARAQAMSALWTFPVVLFASLIAVWAAESAQFLMSQGMALAVLALLQTLPEFSVEAVLSWHASQDDTRIPLVLANVTGSLRLLVGVGMPMVFFVQAFFQGAEAGRRRFSAIRIDPLQCVEVVFLLPGILYGFWIWWKGSLALFDGLVLFAIYVAYLLVLRRLPPETAEGGVLGAVSRRVLSFGTMGRWVCVLGIYLVGGTLLYVSVGPFVGSMEGIAVLLSVPAPIFIQWVSPFLSEFPEKLSAFCWARTVKGAPMALMNIVSSNVSQWTLLIAMIPTVWFVGKGGVLLDLQLDAHQRSEVLLTLMQGLLSFLILADMRFHCVEAIGLFVLFVIQFSAPSLRGAITWVYAAWCLVEALLAAVGLRGCPALDAFAATWSRIARGEPVRREDLAR